MNLYQAQDLDLEPIIIMADTWEVANAEYHFAILRAFGFIPHMNYRLFQTDEDLLPDTHSIRALIGKDQPGFAELSEKGWRHIAFDEE